MDLTFDSDILTYTEKVMMRLRSLYRRYGYEQYKMGKFEEYGLYADNKSFLATGDILTFTDKDGRLMALRPDVTLSIVKNTRDSDGLRKLYYNENVYRPDGYEFKEQAQVGLECIGGLDAALTGEVLMLAWQSLQSLGGRPRLDISHMGFISGLLQGGELTEQQKAELLRCIGEKNMPQLEALCGEFRLSGALRAKLLSLAALCGPFGRVMPELRRLSGNAETDAALSELEGIFDSLKQGVAAGRGAEGGRYAANERGEPGGEGAMDMAGAAESVNFDFSIVNDLSYYSGIIFQGYIDGVPAKVLSGGRYDKLMRRFGKSSGAVGFAVYPNLLERTNPSDGVVSIALPKGRLGERAYAIFEAAGYACPEINEESRRLVFESVEHGVRYFWVKPSDVAIYVQRGVADVGIVGKDILMEHSPDVYELLDLGMGKCRMCVAAVTGFSDDTDKTLRVATKFPAIARAHFDRHGREIDIIKLNGSIEIAPLLGLSDVIVDIVESGNTLRENGLEPIETICEISARIISNKAAYKFRHDAISEMLRRISEKLKVES